MLANKFKMEEVARLKGQLPNLDPSCIEPIFAKVQYPKCRKCGNNDMRMLTGKGLRSLCAACDQDKIQKHIEEFNRIVSAPY